VKLPIQSTPVMRYVSTATMSHLSAISPSDLCEDRPCGVGTGIMCCNGWGQHRDEHACCDVRTQTCATTSNGAPFCQGVEARTGILS
jgi:hypothetical protein